MSPFDALVVLLIWFSFLVFLQNELKRKRELALMQSEKISEAVVALIRLTVESFVQEKQHTEKTMEQAPITGGIQDLVSRSAYRKLSDDEDDPPATISDNEIGAEQDDAIAS